MAKITVEKNTGHTRDSYPLRAILEGVPEEIEKIDKGTDGSWGSGYDFTSIDIEKDKGIARFAFRALGLVDLIDASKDEGVIFENEKEALEASALLPDPYRGR